MIKLWKHITCWYTIQWRCNNLFYPALRVYDGKDTFVLFEQYGWSFTQASVFEWKSWRWKLVYRTDGAYRPTTGGFYQQFRWGIERFLNMPHAERAQHAEHVLTLYKANKEARWKQRWQEMEQATKQ